MDGYSSRTVGRSPQENTNASVRRGKVLLIIPYFGSFGPWFPLYLDSLAQQHTLDLLLLSDGQPPPLPPNARHVRMTLEQLRELATNKLGTTVRLQRSRNICDVRPAYGIIFAEFTSGYEYWAFGDEDVLYGDTDKMLAPYLDGSDLVVPTASGKSGHLTVIRNATRTNELAMRDPAYKQVLVSEEHWAYDETSWRWGNEISSFNKIVKEGEGRGELSIRWGIPKGSGVPPPGRWYAYDGHTLRADDGTELLYYHWGKMRRRQVDWAGPDQARKGFKFDRYGFYDPGLGPARLAVRRAAGRVTELAHDARRRLSKSRARLRTTLSPSRPRPG